ncbi:hypothetical protein [Solimonas sp. K1W22B-7]|uniref:hypothetical protein n=1 Tax=Solimonas sp. K1W22B-7 TaxID=2303331 RepID=UPI0013C4BDD6|nr:hypothetical protein [Solimonas sp. K1W22B-7]
MDKKFEVGDTVESVGSNIRMKVEAIDKHDGSITCSWKRGPAVHRKKFLLEDLAPGTVSAFPNPAREGAGPPNAARGAPRRSSLPARGSPLR